MKVDTIDALYLKPLCLGSKFYLVGSYEDDHLISSSGVIHSMRYPEPHDTEW